MTIVTSRRRPGNGSRVERTRRLLGDAMVQRAENEAGYDLRCPHCQRKVAKFDPPVARLTFPCRRCGGWIDFSTEQVTT